MKRFVWVAVLTVLVPTSVLAHPGPEAHDEHGDIIPGSTIVVPPPAGQHSAETPADAPIPPGTAKARFSQGSWELSITSNATGSGNGVGIGYYLIDNLSISVSLAYLRRDMSTTAGNAWDREDIIYGVRLGYAIPTGKKIVPFVGSKAILTTHSGTGPAAPYDGDNLSLGLDTGFHLLVGDNAAVSIALSYTSIRSDNNLSGGSSEVNSYDSALSYSLFF